MNLVDEDLEVGGNAVAIRRRPANRAVGFAGALKDPRENLVAKAYMGIVRHEEKV